MHISIFTGGSSRLGKFATNALKNSELIIAADEGARTALSYEIIPQIIVGDFDSLDEKTLQHIKKTNCKIISFPREKNETDTELAIIEAIKQGAQKITIIGGTQGDRLDHILSNIFLLTKYKIPIKFVNGNQIIWLEKGPSEKVVEGKKSDYLSLIPLKDDVHEIKTEGLEYKLRKESLYFGNTRGISNVFLKEKAKVKFKKGILLFIHTMV